MSKVTLGGIDVTMNYRIDFNSLCGQSHRERGIDNQDAIAYRQDAHIGVVVLADGAGSRKLSRQGAQAMSNCVAEYAFRNFYQLMRMDDDEIQNEIFNDMLRNLNLLARLYAQKSIREFGSTLIFCATDGKSYIVGHLGDGAVLEYLGDRFRIISYPENTLDRYTTILTTSFHAKRHIRITRGQTFQSSGVILISDGLIPYLFNSAYARKTKEPIHRAIRRATTTTNVANSDDATYIILDWGD
jgi:hypothetical protein